MSANVGIFSKLVAGYWQAREIKILQYKISNAPWVGQI
jgi:hypothetical protein